MTSLIALLIAMTFGTANVADYQTGTPTEQIQFSSDDGVGMDGQGGSRTGNDPDKKG